MPLVLRIMIQLIKLNYIINKVKERLQILLRKHRDWSVIETHQFEQIDQIGEILRCIKLRCVKCGIGLDVFPSQDGRTLWGRGDDRRWVVYWGSRAPVSCRQMMLEKALE